MKEKELYDVIGFLSNLSSLFINIRSLDIRYPAKSVKEALDDTSSIERILNDLFYRKQVMWEHHKYENLDWCLNSITELKEKCDEFSAIFLKQRLANNDKNHFWASILKTWGSYADEASKAIIKSDFSDRSLKPILKSFRKRSYPIVVILINALPDGNPTKESCEEKLEEGLKKSDLRIEQILPKWSAET